MDQKGLLTSLTTFIVMGLLSLATLFTLLILDVRNGQDLLNEQLQEEHRSPAASETVLSSAPLIHTDPRLLTQVQQIEEAILQLSHNLINQPTAANNSGPQQDLMPQLQKIEQALQQIPHTPTQTDPTPEQVTETLNALSESIQQQQLSTLQLSQQIDRLLQQGEAQQGAIESIQSRIDTPPASPPSSEAIQALVEKLDTLTHQQQQVETTLLHLKEQSQQDRPYRYQAR